MFKSSAPDVGGGGGASGASGVNGGVNGASEVDLGSSPSWRCVARLRLRLRLCDSSNRATKPRGRLCLCPRSISCPSSFVCGFVCLRDDYRLSTTAGDDARMCVVTASSSTTSASIVASCARCDDGWAIAMMPFGAPNGAPRA